MASLSLQLAQWNWIIRADADCLQVDGKTLCSFTVVSYYIDLQQPKLLEIRIVNNEYVETLQQGWVFVYLINYN